MRAKSEIMNTLADQMSSSDVWKKLKNSLLGKELLALGAEIISENENIKDTMLLQLNPDTADKDGLIMLSQMNEIPITNIKPSSVVVQMLEETGPEGQEVPVKTYAPFELVYNVGNVAFRNIEYTMKGKTVSLVNGTHKCYIKGTSGNISVDGAQIDGSETYFYDGVNSYYGIKLGNAYPDSIIMVDENGIEIQRYSSDVALSNTVGVMYKVITGVDSNIYIRFVCKEDYEAPTTYKIEWLDHSASEFDIENYDVMDGNNKVAEIKYYSQGTVDDVEFMRQQLKKEMAKYNGLNTPSSVERYVRGLPYVLDAKCAKDESGINVYVKPSSYLDLQTYLDFSEIAAHISLNSVLFPNIKVKTGKQIKFGIEISGIKDEKLQYGIKKLLQDKFSYENMTFNTVINTSNILSEIYGKYGVVPTVNMTIREEFVQDKSLSFKPIKNTMKLYNNQGSIVAWEENDLLYGKAASSNKIPFLLFRVVGCMGTMFLLMYTGQPDTSNPDETVFPLTGYNRFYLYDASTNTIKPFDGAMKNLLYTDTNPALKYNAWDTDTQSFGNLYDIEFLSTNNALVVHLVFKSSGTELDANDNYVYWSSTNTKLYNDYKNEAYKYEEYNEKYKGKYQTIFFIKTPLALKNVNSDSWNIFQDASHGDPNDMQGLYSGLRNYCSGNKLGIKSNWFIYNNKQYYAYSISDKYISITNGTKNLAISLNGNFLGMMPYKDDLYVINEKYITRIVGFEGLKEKEEIYQIYKDINTTMTVIQVVREFDNQIILKTNEGWYTATGFEILAGNKISFKDLKRIFTEKDSNGNDVDALNSNCIIGGCTKDYITAYEEVETTDSTSGTVTNGVIFYCYDINTRMTYKYDKSTTSTIIGENATSSTETEQYSDKINIATYWPAPKEDDSLMTDEEFGMAKFMGGNSGRLVYYMNEGTIKELDKDKYKDIFLVKKNATDFLVFVDNVPVIIDGNEGTRAVPLFLTINGNTQGVVGDGGQKWYDTKEGEDKYNQRIPVSFYKICYSLFYKNIADIEKKYRSGVTGPTQQIITETLTGTKTTTIKTTTYLDYTQETVYTHGGINSSTGSFEKPYTKQDWYSTPLHISILNHPDKTPGSGEDQSYPLYITYCDDSSSIEKYQPISDLYITRKISGYYTNVGLTVPAADITADWNDEWNYGRDGVQCYKLFTTRYFTKNIEYIESGFNIDDTTDEEELTTVGYYDNTKNSCVNDRGTEIAYIRYKTQNPNLSDDSYLVLDNNEINFV